MNSTKKQRGFGLVELMISLVIGLLLLAGILEIMLGNQESFRAQQHQAALQENIRLASFLLSNSLSLAGFRIDGLRDEDDVFTTGPVITSTEGGSSDTPDSIRIRFEGQGGQRDCLGSKVIDPGADGIAGTADDKPQIADFEYSVANGSLRCNNMNDTAPPQPLINNVENMQIEYGLDTNADGSVDRYMQADNTAFNQAQVRSIRIQLLLASPGDVLPQPTAQSYALLDNNGGPINVTDRKQRQVLEQVIALRNRLR